MGHVVSNEGIPLDLKNIKAIMEWTIPRNVGKVKSSMGLESCYRWFIGNFSLISYHITSLQAKGKNFEWTKECETLFEQVKHFLKNSPVLKIADPNKEFMVCTNVCKEGLGGVLMQEGQFVCYESRNLNEHERNYAMHDLELEIIIHELEMWRHYLLGRRFILMTDHIGMRYLFNQPNLNSRKAKWLAILCKFYFGIRYIKGKDNKVGNALNTGMHVNHISAVSSYGTDL